MNDLKEKLRSAIYLPLKDNFRKLRKILDMIMQSLKLEKEIT